MAATEGILRIPQQLPVNQRDWEQFTRALNAKIKYDGQRAVVDALTTIATRTGTDIDTLLSYLTDEGRAEDQRFLPQVSAGNKLSVQSVQPLTSTAGSLTAQIDIAAHTLRYGFGPVSYNAGNISGMPVSTLHYVYADDPDFLGGAVTYLATTSPQTVTADNGRYYLGSITTPAASTSRNIIAASSTNPVVFQTAVNHGWITGNLVDFAALPGDFGTAFNSGNFSITVIDLDEFSVAVDGLLFAPYTSGGTATRVTGTSGGGGGGGGSGGGGLIP